MDYDFYIDNDPVIDRYFDLSDDNFVNELDDDYELELWREVSNETEEMFGYSVG